MFSTVWLALSAGCGPAAEEPARRQRTWAQSGAETLVLAPSADATVDARQPDVNLGAEEKLVADGSPERAAYLGFEVVTAGAPTSAKLRLFVLDPSSNAPAVFATEPPGTAWTEGGLTWRSRPAPRGTALADAAAVAEGTWLEYDVTAQVTGSGVYGFTLVSSSGNGVDFASREWEDASLRPQLVLTVAGPGTRVSDCEGTVEELVVPVNWDTYVTEEAPDTSFLTAERLAADGRPRQVAYLNFEPDPDGRPVLDARLRLWARDGASGGFQVHTASVRSNLASLTWNDPLALYSQVLGPVAVVDEAWSDFDVTAAVNTDADDFGVTFALVSTSGDGASFTSSEGDGGTRPPHLVLTLGRTCNYHGNGTSGRLAQGLQLTPAESQRLEDLEAGPDGGWVTLMREQPGDFWLRRFGADGALTLTRHIAQGSASMRLAVTPLGNVLLAADYTELTLEGQVLPPASEGDRRLVLAKLRPDGSLDWFHVSTPTGGLVEVREVRTDASGSLVVAGSFEGTLSVGGEPLESGAGPSSAFLARVKWDGTHLWSRALPSGQESTEAESLAVREDGTVLVGGRLGTGATLDGKTAGGERWTPFLARYEADGTLAWAKLLEGARFSVEAVTATPEGWAFAFNLQGGFAFAGGEVRVEQPGWDSGLVVGAVGLDGSERWARLLGSAWAYPRTVGLGARADGTLVLAGRTGGPLELGGGYLGQYATPFLASYTADGGHLWSRTLIDWRVNWDEPHPMNRPSFALLSTGAPLLGAVQMDPLTVEGRSFELDSFPEPLLLLRFTP